MKMQNASSKKRQKKIDFCRKNSGTALDNLGKCKIQILDESIKPFIREFEKLNHVELSESQGLNELQKMALDHVSFTELKELQSMATSMAGGIASGAMAGALTAFGAYGAAGALATASTGTAIAGLSGAAATNATLAFFGGGSLAAGGLGMAGGTAVLGGLVAGPALAVLGIVVGAKASANLDKAYSNLANAKEFKEEMDAASALCIGIRKRAAMFNRFLLSLNSIFEPLVYEMSQIIERNGTDFRLYSSEDKTVIAESMAMAGAIKSILDTPILDVDGNLTPESGKIISLTKGQLKKKLNTQANSSSSSSIEDRIPTISEQTEQEAAEPQSKQSSEDSYFCTSHIISINPILKESSELQAQYFLYLKKLLHLIPHTSGECIQSRLDFYKYALFPIAASEDTENIHLKRPEFCYLLPFDLFEILDSQRNTLTYEQIQSINRQIIADHNLPQGSDNLLIQEFRATYGDESVWNQILSAPQAAPFVEYLRRIQFTSQFAHKKPYNLLITATMSAGKSTLINAIAGKTVCMAANTACTSRIHAILSKPFEDGLISRVTPPDTANIDSSDYTNQTPLPDKSITCTYFNGPLGSQRIVLLDSPGVNSSENPLHTEITQNVIQSDAYDLLIYVLNATNLCSTDEQQHLEFTAKKWNKAPIIFVLNKADKLISEDDDLGHVIEQQIEFLNSMGFKNSILCPVSSKAAYLAKKSQMQKLNRIDQGELDNFANKFQYCSLAPYYQTLMAHLKIPFHDHEAATLLEDCGFRYLEEIIKYFMEEKAR